MWSNTMIMNMLLSIQCLLLSAGLKGSSDCCCCTSIEFGCLSVQSSHVLHKDPRIVSRVGSPHIGLYILLSYSEKETKAYHICHRSKKMWNLTTSDACARVVSLSSTEALVTFVSLGCVWVHDAWLEVKKKSCFSFKQRGTTIFLPLKVDEQSWWGVEVAF
jgi:hypothetical protein